MKQMPALKNNPHRHLATQNSNNSLQKESIFREEGTLPSKLRDGSMALAKAYTTELEKTAQINT